VSGVDVSVDEPPADPLEPRDIVTVDDIDPFGSMVTQ
jgi:hypothetical protein